MSWKLEADSLSYYRRLILWEGQGTYTDPVLGKCFRVLTEADHLGEMCQGNKLMTTPQGTCARELAGG